MDRRFAEERGVDAGRGGGGGGGGGVDDGGAQSAVVNSNSSSRCFTWAVTRLYGAVRRHVERACSSDTSRQKLRSRPRRRRLSTEYLRRSRGGAATRLRNTRVVMLS